MSIDIQELRNTLQHNLQALLGSEDPFTDLEDLTERGLDSLIMVNLIIILEDDFNILFENEDLIIQNFSTIGRMIEIVKQKHS